MSTHFEYIKYDAAVRRKQNIVSGVTFRILFAAWLPAVSGLFCLVIIADKRNGAVAPCD